MRYVRYLSLDCIVHLGIGCIHGVSPLNTFTHELGAIAWYRIEPKRMGIGARRWRLSRMVTGRRAPDLGGCVLGGRGGDIGEGGFAGVETEKERDVFPVDACTCCWLLVLVMCLLSQFIQFGKLDRTNEPHNPYVSL